MIYFVCIVLFYDKYQNIWLAKIRDRINRRLIFSLPNKHFSLRLPKYQDFIMTIKLMIQNIQEYLHD